MAEFGANFDCAFGAISDSAQSKSRATIISGSPAVAPDHALESVRLAVAAFRSALSSYPMLDRELSGCRLSAGIITIQLVSLVRTNLNFLNYSGSGFLGLPATTVGPLLLRLVMRVRFFVVVAALATVEEQNLLRVAGTHTDSFRSWSCAVKRSSVHE